MECWANGVRGRRWVLPVLVVATACVVFHRDRYSASDLAIVPDSVEYAVAAHHLASQGEYKIAVAGRDLPPRYQPWFSLFFITPAYVLAGPHPGNAIIPVTLLAVLGVIVAFAVGRTIAGDLGGVWAGLALIALPLYRYYGREVMTDVPCTALLLLLCLLYLRLFAHNHQPSPINHEPSTISPSPSADPLLPYACAGLVGALCAAIRPPFICSVLPFLLAAPREKSRLQSILRAAVLLIPPFAVICAGMVCNFLSFGSVLRSGYHFWCPVPYDFPALTLSARYLGPNAAGLAASGLGACIVLSPVIVLLGRSRMKRTSSNGYDAARRALIFAALSCFPAAVFHMLYFYPDPRFFLPIAVVLLVPAVGAIALCLPLRPGSPLPAVCQATALAFLIVVAAVVPDVEPTRRMAADRIDAHTPADALIVSAVDPAYLEFMTCRSTQRGIIPVSRRVEYASKVNAADRLHVDPVPIHWTDYNRAALIMAGAADPMPNVAMGNDAMLAGALVYGMPVYIDTSHFSKEEMAWLSGLQGEFKLVGKAEHLYQLAPRQGSEVRDQRAGAETRRNTE